MEWLVSNWYLVIAGIAVIVAVVGACVYFFKLPSTTQIENLKEWLKFAVTEAEKALGSGTGQLKLRMVYDMAIAKFPWLSFISFTTFNDWVKEALEWMEDQLKKNGALKAIVKGE